MPAGGVVVTGGVGALGRSASGRSSSLEVRAISRASSTNFSGVKPTTPSPLFDRRSQSNAAVRGTPPLSLAEQMAAQYGWAAQPLAEALVESPPKEEGSEL
jgi:hypothetical protein